MSLNNIEYRLILHSYLSCKFGIAVFVGMNRDWCQFKVHPDTVTITQSNLFAGFNSYQEMHQDQDVL